MQYATTNNFLAALSHMHIANKRPVGNDPEYLSLLIHNLAVEAGHTELVANLTNKITLA
jgi:hypothetical protein